MMTKKPAHLWLKEEIQKIEKNSCFTEAKKPSLLIHACCGPCSSYVLEYLEKTFTISLYFYNPNIYPQAEYERRKDELLAFIEKYNNRIQVITEKTYQVSDFYEATGVKTETDLQKEGERGERCRRCYAFRIKKAFIYAREHGFDYITTTLSISPHKDAEKINAIGRALEEELLESEQLEDGAIAKKTENKPRFLYADFKKNKGFLRSLELSKEFGLYRQDYCGCMYSIRDGIIE